MSLATETGLFTAVLLGLFFLLYRLNRNRQRRLLATVEVITIENVTSEFLQNSRDLYIYLPPQYHQQPQKRYPILYLNDGQDRQQFKLHETLANLYQRHLIRPIIVVAIPTNEDRLQEYGTAIAPNAQGLGKKAALYGRFLTQELIPLINTRFRTAANARDTAVAGVSLGGLSAFDLAWNHPQQFSIVGVFSGSFWWRTAADETSLLPNQLIMPQIVRQQGFRPHFRIWLEAATRDETSDRDNNGVIDAIQDTWELIDALVSVGFQEGKAITYFEIEGGRHNYETWSKILPDFLMWAFPAGSA